MKFYLKLSLLLLLNTAILNAQSTKENLKNHVYTLADDSMKGRKAGSVEAERTAQYIIEQWKAIGIEAYKTDNYFHHFDNYKNIIGVLEGQDSDLKDEYIVVGAHYDHIGYKIEDGDTIIYNGADDNASGTATLIEMARQLKSRQSELRRSVILVAFDAEEIGLVGSNHFISDKVFPIEKIKFMMSVDMVGWYSTNTSVIYSGCKTGINLENILRTESIVPEGLKITTEDFEKNIFVATDTKAFAESGIPTLAVSTGLKSPYHKPEDDADLIDYDGMALITEHLTNFTIKLSNEESIETTGKSATKHRKQKKLFEFGALANIGSNHHYYTEGALDGKSAFSYGVGLSGQVNMGWFAIRPEVYFENIGAKYPQGNINSQNITIPLNLVVQTKDASAGFDVFVGPYYSLLLNGKQGKEALDFDNTFNDIEWGINWGVGIKMGHFKIGYSYKSAITSFTKQVNADNAYIKNRTNFVTIGWIF